MHVQLWQGCKYYQSVDPNAFNQTVVTELNQYKMSPISRVVYLEQFQTQLLHHKSIGINP